MIVANNKVPMKSLSILVLLSVLSRIAKATTLVRQGRLVSVNTDSSDLTFGGTFSSNSAGGGCSSNTYYDDCPGISGTRVYAEGSSSNGAFYILNGDSVTYCGRWRRESVCQTNNGLGTTVTTPVSYGGSTTVWRITSSSTEIASLPISSSLSYASCSGVCTDPNNTGNLVFPLQGSSICTVAAGWMAVNDDYNNSCASQETCKELVVTQGCEGSYTGSVAGTYRPMEDTSSCSGDYVDKTRTVYVKSDGNKYLFHRATQDEWVFNSFCSSLGNSKGYFDAADEPFLSTEDEVQCYDGGFGDDKDYEWTTLSMSCKKKSGGGGGGGGGGISSAKFVNVQLGLFLILAGAFLV